MIDDTEIVLEGFDPADRERLRTLVPQVYDQLRRLASSWMGDERPGHTLQPTAVVNEAYLRMAEQDDARFNDSSHFFIIAARVMRRVLVDYARGRKRQKRGDGWHRVTLAGLGSNDGARAVDLLALADALDRLGELDTQAAGVVELRFFGGLDIDRTAEVLGIARSTAAEDWRFARAWLAKELFE
mgnify:CR=1 FL=1